MTGITREHRAQPYDAVVRLLQLTVEYPGLQSLVVAADHNTAQRMLSLVLDACHVVREARGRNLVGKLWANREICWADDVSSGAVSRFVSAQNYGALVGRRYGAIYAVTSWCWRDEDKVMELLLPALDQEPRILLENG